MRRNLLLSSLMPVLLALLSSTPSGATVGLVDSGRAFVENAVCDQHAVDCHNVMLDDGCDMHTKRCPEGQTPRLPATVMNGQLIAPLRPFINEQVYQMLYQALGGDKEGEPDPIPPILPEDLPFFIKHNRHLGFAGADAYFNVTFNLSAGGVGVRGHSNTSTNLTLGSGAQPPAEDGQVPCNDWRGCPDLIVERSALMDGDIIQKTFASTDCGVLENSTQAGTRRLLRFTFTSPNIGHGDLVIGDPHDHPEWFEWGTCHNHWHFKEYADYRFWNISAYLEWREKRNEEPGATPAEIFQENPELLDGFIAGHKQGFCAIDLKMVLPFQLSPKYFSCATNQGISSGWADVYDYRLDGQWIDITGVAPGIYVLEAEVNPERLFQEEDYTRNSGAVLVQIP